jgi:hypothetical protein
MNGVSQFDKVIRYQRDGLLHKSNGPALTWEDGSCAWMLYGNQHRYYGPWAGMTGGWRIHNTILKHHV